MLPRVGVETGGAAAVEWDVRVVPSQRDVVRGVTGLVEQIDNDYIVFADVWKLSHALKRCIFRERETLTPAGSARKPNHRYN